MKRRTGIALMLWMIALVLFTSPSVLAQDRGGQIPYGANRAAGHYLQVEDAKIYYEMYGEGGTPIVLLHGGLYGYIEEFGGLIEELSKSRRVIAIATRGHGKSEIGTQPFSYVLFANDALAVIRKETTGKIDLLGFSDGALTAYTFAAAHPQLLRRLVAIGGPRGVSDWTPQALAEFHASKPGDVERDSPQFVAERKKLMPDPERWNEFVERLMKLWDVPVIVTDDQLRAIQLPTLIVAGDHDPYNQTMKFVEIYQTLPEGQLAVIPGCGHVVLECKGPFTIEAVKTFLDRK